MADNADDMQTLYLIDGHAQFFRAYHAIRSAMSSPVTKEPTNMTYGFVGMLLKLLREYQPEYLAVVIDKSGDRETFRSEIYPEYKATRDEPPDDLHPQIERCLDVLDQMRVPVFAEEGVEADDVIASIVQKLKRERPDLRIRIVSKDKDLTQLLSDRVELFDVHKDQAVTAEDIFKTEGVEPHHVRDILALMGDSIDNIPGVPGIGPKTAAQLILRYGSIDALYEHLDEIKGKRRENLDAARDQVPISRRLVELRDDLDINFDLDAAKAEPTALPAETLLATFRELGFNRYPDDLAKIVGADRVAEASKQSAASSSSTSARRAAEDAMVGGLFDQPADDAPESQTAAAVVAASSDPGDYRAVTSKRDLDQLVRDIKTKQRVAVDTETDGLSPMQSNLCGISIALEPRAGVYIPIRSPEPDTHLDQQTVIEALRPVFENTSIEKVGHNLKFDMNILRRHGVQLRGFHDAAAFDTMVASYVIDATRSSHKLDVLALALLDHTCIPITDLIGKGKKQTTFDTVPLDMAVPYAAEDADVTLRLHEKLADELEQTGLRKLFDDVEMPLVEVLAELEYNGIRIDPDELDRQRDKLSERIEALRDEISESSHHPFNPDSPRQLAAALFNKPDGDPPGLGLKVLRRGKTGPSTDQEVLEKLAADPDVESRIPELILEYRQLTKLVNTYLVALKDAINPQTGRIHASFNQTVAATGRLSSSDPNLQNIPVRTEVGRQIRRAFVAEPDHVLITADYSQIELRLLAHLSEDPALIEAFHEDADIHRAVAAEVFGVDPDDVTSTQRSSAKMVNFGIVYGVTPYGLARRLGDNTSVEQARAIIDNYKSRFARITDFLEQCVQAAKDHGYVETILGRRRSIPQVESNNAQQRALGERMAINTVVQGSAADLIKLAMIDLHRRLPESFPDARMLLQIHDELVFEAPADRGEPLRDLAVERMEAAMALRVPLVVEAAVSTCWLDAK